MADGAEAGRLPTGIRPDAVTDLHVVLIKACPTLRLTQQIRLAAFMAHSQSRKVLLIVRGRCAFAPDLEEFIAQTGLVEVDRR